MKQAFSFIELIVVIVLTSLLIYFAFPKPLNSELHQATSRLLLYLKQTRYLATIDQAYESSDPLWHKGRWTLKFLDVERVLEVCITLYIKIERVAVENIQDIHQKIKV